MARFTVLENSPTRLAIGGWRIANIIMVLFMVALPVGFYVLIVQQEPAAIWVNLFVLLVVGALVPRLTLWERIEFDSEAAEATFDQLRPIGRLRRKAPLKPVSRVQIETISNSSNNKPSRRLALVTGHDRTPFTRLYSSGRLDDEKTLINDWLKQAFGDRWREAAMHMTEASEATAGTDVPDGVTRIRHPATGLTLDIPTDWSASVSFDKSGPLTIFGITLFQRLDRSGERRAPGDGADWNRLIATGVEDAGLTVSIRDGPLDRTLDSTLNDPWSKHWGVEVLKTTAKVELGGMTGFSIARRIPKGGSNVIFGEVGADVAFRQVCLATGRLHVETRRDRRDLPGS